MSLQLLANTFKYVGHEGSKGAIFHGAVFIDEDIIYLLHNKHTWDPTNTGWSLLGALGILIHHLRTRKKPVTYPFLTTELSLQSEDLLSLFHEITVLPTTMMAIVPKCLVTGMSKSFMKGAIIQVGDVAIAPMGAKGKAWAQLESWGYAAEGESTLTSPST